MSDVSWALQKALYQRLSVDDGIKSVIGDPARIYDDPPEDAAFPYLVIGETKASDWGGVDGAMSHELRLYAFSRHAGRREVKQVMSAVYDAVHEQDLSVDGARLVYLRYVFGDVWRKQDGDTYQGVMRYRAVTEPL